MILIFGPYKSGNRAPADGSTSGAPIGPIVALRRSLPWYEPYQKKNTKTILIIDKRM